MSGYAWTADGRSFPFRAPGFPRAGCALRARSPFLLEMEWVPRKFRRWLRKGRDECLTWPEGRACRSGPVDFGRRREAVGQSQLNFHAITEMLIAVFVAAAGAVRAESLLLRGSG